MVPNVAALAGDDENADFMTRDNLPSGDSSLSDIMDLLNDLKELGVDVKALMPQIQQIMKSGFRFKYSQENGALELYADKEMCDPIINAFLPALPKLDELLAGMADNPDISAEENSDSRSRLTSFLSGKTPRHSGFQSILSKPKFLR